MSYIYDALSTRCKAVERSTIQHEITCLIDDTESGWMITITERQCSRDLVAINACSVSQSSHSLRLGILGALIPASLKRE